MPRRAHIPTSLMLACGLLVTSFGALGCKESKQVRLPPGDWLGRCPKGAVATEQAATARTDHSIDDSADLLAPSVEAELDRLLTAFHAETCHQIAIVTIPSLDGQAIEERSLALAKQRGYGYAGFNNGVLLLVARTENKARIAVGCGLEDVISDAQAADILKQRMIPAFRAGDFGAGARAGVLALIELARKKHIPEEYRPPGCPSRS
jgi:uncharacterized membrane protein YgcG